MNFIDHWFCKTCLCLKILENIQISVTMIVNCMSRDVVLGHGKELL